MNRDQRKQLQQALDKATTVMDDMQEVVNRSEVDVDRELIPPTMASLYFDPARVALEDVLDELAGIRDDEESKLENMPDSLRDSDKGYAMEEAIENLNSAIDYVQEALDEIETGIGALRAARPNDEVEAGKAMTRAVESADSVVTSLEEALGYFEEAMV